MKTIDARGLSCPQPVVLTRNAMKSGEDSYQVLVDNSTAKENVSRFAANLGYNVKVTEKDDEFTLDITRK